MILGAMKKMLAEALPFVARNPERQMAWLVGEFRKGTLGDQELTPYIHLLVLEYVARKQRGEGVSELRGCFTDLPRDIIVGLLRCVDIYDVADLLELVGQLTVDEAILVLKKAPPPYEKKSLLLLDRVFQAVNGGGDHLLARAAQKMVGEGDAPGHFVGAYQRFQEILLDEKILMQLYPQAKG